MSNLFDENLKYTSGFENALESYEGQNEKDSESEDVVVDLQKELAIRINISKIHGAILAAFQQDQLVNVAELHIMKGNIEQIYQIKNLDLLKILNQGAKLFQSNFAEMMTFLSLLHKSDALKRSELMIAAKLAFIDDLEAYDLVIGILQTPDSIVDLENIFVKFSDDTEMLKSALFDLREQRIMSAERTQLFKETINLGGF